MSRQYVSDIVWPVRQQTLDCSATSVWIVDTITLDRKTPRLVKRRLVIGGIHAGELCRLDEKRPGILRARQQDAAVPIDVCLNIVIQVQKVREDQPKWF